MDTKPIGAFLFPEARRLIVVPDRDTLTAVFLKAELEIVF